MKSLRPSSHLYMYHELLHALHQEGCSICHIEAKGINRYLDNLLYENVNDPDVRARLRSAHGLCHRHAWQLATIHGCSLGIAIIYRDVLRTILQELDRKTANEKRRFAWALRASNGSIHADQLTPQGPCLACAQQEEIAQRYLLELLRYLDDPQFAPHFAASDGLCLPHLRQALRLAEGETQRQILLDAQWRIWQRLLDELDEFIRKNDYRYASEGFGTEGDSWLRVLAALSGNR